MLYDTGKTSDDPIKFNIPSPWNDPLTHGFGCISAKACTECGAIMADSICLCSGCFTCLRCGHKNGNTDFLPLRPSQDIEIIRDGLGI